MPYSRIKEMSDGIDVVEYQISPKVRATYNKKKRKRGTYRGDRKNRYRRLNNLLKLEREFTDLVRFNTGPVTPPALVTLTMLEILGIKQAYRAFSVFIRRLRAYSEGNFRHIAVPEFQKRGAVHFHVLMWGLSSNFYDDPSKGKETAENDLGETVSRRIQNIWQRGYVDSLLTNGSHQLAGYLAKYMRKAMHDERLLGQKAFTASRNILRPVLHKVEEAFDDVSDYYLEGYEEVPSYEQEFKTKFLGKGRHRYFKKK